MKNAPLFALIAVVVTILILFAYGIYLNLSQGTLGTNVLGMVCTAAFLIVAILGWELLMKGSLYPGRWRGRKGK